jgi:hypothetical protein
VIKKQDIVATLVQAHNHICLAIIEILGFEHISSKTRSTEVNMDDLEKDKNGFTVFGQILELKAAPSLLVDLQPINWLWTGHYMRFGARAEKALTTATSRQYVVRIPGKLIYPLGPTVVSTPKSWMDTEANIPSHTWSITTQDLDEILEVAWDALSPDTEEIISNIEMLPVLSQSDLPYLNHLGVCTALASNEFY